MLSTLDVPQANDLHSVRMVVSAVRHGAARQREVAQFTGFSKRHVAYRLHAARVLGWLAFDGEAAHLLGPGEALLATPVGSPAERVFLFEAVKACAIVQHLAPDLLAAQGPERDALTETLLRESRLSRATADRRARGLLHWRAQVMPKPAPPAPAPPPPPAPAQPAGQPAGQLSLFG